MDANDDRCHHTKVSEDYFEALAGWLAVAMDTLVAMPESTLP